MGRPGRPCASGPIWRPGRGRRRWCLPAPGRPPGPWAAGRWWGARWPRRSSSRSSSWPRKGGSRADPSPFFELFLRLFAGSLGPDPHLFLRHVAVCDAGVLVVPLLDVQQVLAAREDRPPAEVLVVARLVPV